MMPEDHDSDADARPDAPDRIWVVVLDADSILGHTSLDYLIDQEFHEQDRPLNRVRVAEYQLVRKGRFSASFIEEPKEPTE